MYSTWCNSICGSLLGSYVHVQYMHDMCTVQGMYISVSLCSCVRDGKLVCVGWTLSYTYSTCYDIVSLPNTVLALGYYIQLYL